MFDVPLGAVVDAHPAKTPEHCIIDGRHASLVPMSSEHAPYLYQHLCLNSPDATWAYMFAGPFADEDSFFRYIETLVASKDPLFFTVVSNDTLPGGISAGTPVGYLSLMRIDAKNRGIELGSIIFSAALQRTTVATEALYLIMNHCFEVLDNRRLEWKCDSLNAKSRRAAERLGFVFEGIFRKHFIVRGRNRDTAWYSVVEDEWPMGKEVFERWLQDGNFGGEGKQKEGLEDIRRQMLKP